MIAYLIGVVGVTALTGIYPICIVLLILQLLFIEYYIYNRKQVFAYLNIKKVSFLGGRQLPKDLKLSKFQRFIYWLVKP